MRPAYTSCFFWNILISSKCGALFFFSFKQSHFHFHSFSNPFLSVQHTESEATPVITASTTAHSQRYCRIKNSSLAPKASHNPYIQCSDLQHLKKKCAYIPVYCLDLAKLRCETHYHRQLWCGWLQATPPLTGVTELDVWTILVLLMPFGIYLSDKLSTLLVEHNIQDVCASPLVSENLSVLLAVIRRYVAANHQS